MMTEEIVESNNERKYGPNYKNGRYLNKQGYWNIYKPDHLYVLKDGYVKEHRLVYEEYYKCCLLPFTDIHHIDDNRQNNKIENLKPMYRGQHITHHKKGKQSTTRINMSDRICSICNNNTTYLRTRDKRPCWHILNNKFICGLCYSRK